MGADLRTSRSQCEQAFASLPGYVWLAGPDGAWCAVSAAWAEHTGRHSETHLGQEWQQVLHHEDRPRVSEAWNEAMRLGVALELECRVRSATGSFHSFHLRASPVFDEQGRRYAWCGTWAELGQALQEEDHRKNEFLAMLSHELRNPLAPILASVRILERSAPGGGQAQRARQVIERQALHLTRLVDDLLDLTRISRGKISLQQERIELNTLVRRTAEDHQEVFAREGVVLEVTEDPGPVCVDGDSTRLAQVVGNLLSNAAKFTPRGGRTLLEVQAALNEAVIRVKDDGVGIAPPVLSELFRPFVQADTSLDRPRGGLGLGLALVKGLVEMHGGSVSARSDGGGLGAEFTVRLPLSEASAPPEHSPAPAERTSNGRRVLVIEDNVDAAQSLKDLLELSGHEVEVAYSGPEGLEKAREFIPDIVLCDLGLPGIDGFQVARAIRGEPRLDSIVLVALSGYALPEDVERSLEAGFSRHLAKPPDLELLEKVLEEAPQRPSVH